MNMKVLTDYWGRELKIGDKVLTCLDNNWVEGFIVGYDNRSGGMYYRTINGNIGFDDGVKICENRKTNSWGIKGMRTEGVFIILESENFKLNIK